MQSSFKKVKGTSLVLGSKIFSLQFTNYILFESAQNSDYKYHIISAENSKFTLFLRKTYFGVTALRLGSGSTTLARSGIGMGLAGQRPGKLMFFDTIGIKYRKTIEIFLVLISIRISSFEYRKPIPKMP